MNNKTILKSLPLLTIFTASLVLSPAIAIAAHGDHSYSKEKYSHDDRRSHSKSHNRSNKRGNKHNYRSNGKGHNRHSSTHHDDKRHGHHNDHARYKHRHDDHRHDHHTTYVVNDHYYDDHFYGLDHLRFMIGLHTNNFDITFRD